MCFSCLKPELWFALMLEWKYSTNVCVCDTFNTYWEYRRDVVIIQFGPTLCLFNMKCGIVYVEYYAPFITSYLLFLCTCHLHRMSILVFYFGYRGRAGDGGGGW